MYYTGSVANSKPLEKDDYWIANVVFGWQGEVDMDYDPKDEMSASFGLTPMRDGGHCTVVSGWDVSYICTETIRDAFFETGDIEDKTILTTAHEIGHQFGLTHGFPFNTSPIDNCAACIGDCINVGIMSAAATNLQPFFIPFHINLLRSRTKAPKQ